MLAPILFALVIDSMQVKFSNSTLVKFADDVTLLHFLRSSEDDHLQEEYNHLLAWSASHGMFINPDKTKLMHFQTKRSIVLRPLIDNLSSSIIEVVSSAKLLGIIIDDKISWQEHLSFIISKIKKTYLYALRFKSGPRL